MIFRLSYISYLKKYCTQQYADLPNVDTFHYTLQESHLFISSLISTEKYFKYCEAVKLIVADTSFPKLKFHANAHILSLATNTTLEVTGSPCSFSRKRLPST